MGKFIRNHCEHCGQYYEGRGRGTRFCSNSCRTTAFNLRDNPAKRPEVRAKMSESLRGHKFGVGRAVSDETRRKLSESLKGRPTGRKGISPTPEQRDKIRATLLGRYTGDKNPNWRGGTSPRDWTSTRYKQFLHAVWSRERGHCQACGRHCKSGKEAHVHHVKSWIDAPELRYEPDNGMLLCVKCHDIRREGRPATPEARAKVSAFARQRPRDERGVFTKVPPA